MFANVYVVNPLDLIKYQNEIFDDGYHSNKDGHELDFYCIKGFRCRN